MALLLKNATLVDPQVDLYEQSDLLIEDGVISRVGCGLKPGKAEVVDLSDKTVVPGLVDMHVHLREPGQEYKEDIASGCRAAVHGGFTDIACMPNTNPVCDSGSKVEAVLARAAEVGLAEVHPVGAITSGLEGKQIAEMGDMYAHGAVAFSDDGRGVQDDQIMRTALEYSKQFNVALLSHCQRDSLSAAGQVNEGYASTRLGLAGWPALAEELQIERDLALAALCDARIHIQHCTTSRGAGLVRMAKKNDVKASCEVTPHHLFLCEDDLDENYNTNLKMNPPLRTRMDMEDLQDAVCAGLVDVVATDHAPHAAHEKEVEFELAPFGTTGLETALPLMLDRLVATKRLPIERLVILMSINPRKILNLAPVRLEEGSLANLTVIDLDAKVDVTPDYFESKASNSAFLGEHLRGAASETIVKGRFVMRSGVVL